VPRIVDRIQSVLGWASRVALAVQRCNPSIRNRHSGARDWVQHWAQYRDMSRFLLQGGSLTITGADGLRRFNSDDGLFHVVGSPINGSISTGNAVIVGDGAGANRSDVYNLGSCQAGCTDIIGSVSFNGGSVVLSNAGGLVGSTGVPNNIWQCVMGGSAIVLYQDGHGPNTASNPNLGLYQMVYFYFQISGTTVQLVRRLWVSKASQGSMTINPVTVSYRLKAGLYT
jgi:hypothetical protein